MRRLLFFTIALVFIQIESYEQCVISEFPWNEGFETTMGVSQNFNDCIIQQSVSGSRSWSLSSSENYSGNNSILLYWNNEDWMFFPIEVEEGQEYNVQLFAKRYSGGYDNDIVIMYGDDADSTSMIDTVVPARTVGSSYTKLSGTITAQNTGVVYIGIKGRIENDFGSVLYIDDISVCKCNVSPSNVSIISKTDHSATISISDSVANLWEIAIDTVGAVLGNGTRIISDSTIIILDGLSSDTEYQYTVRSICSEGDTGLWRSNATFETYCDAISEFPWNEDFESGYVSGQRIDGCWISSARSSREYWTANSTSTEYNTSPYEGEWNATIENSSVGTIYKNLYLIADHTYSIEIFARQGNSDSNLARLKLLFGSKLTTDSIVEMMPFVRLQDGDYQRIYQTFKPNRTGHYFVGINGYTYAISNAVISIDNITIDEVPCPTPSNLYSVSIAASNVTLTWTPEGFESQWEIEYGVAGFEIGTGTRVLVDNNEYTIEQLVENTNYEFYIRAKCDVDEESDWTEALSLTTNECFDNQIPFFEDFESGYSHFQELTGCWELEIYDGISNWEAVNSYRWPSYEGSWCGYLESTSISWMYMPINLIGGKTYYFEMYARTNSSRTNNLNLAVAYGLEPSFTEMNNDIIESRSVSSSYRSYTNSFTPYQSGAYYLGIRGGVTSADPYLLIDNISVSACPKPNNLDVDSVTHNSVFLLWESIESNLTYQIEYGEHSFTQGTGSIVISDTLNYHLNSLSSDTQYDYYVRAFNNEGDTSFWAGPYSFTTDISCYEPNNIMADTIGAHTSSIFWNTVSEAVSWEYQLIVNGTDIENYGTSVYDTIVDLIEIYSNTNYDFYVRSYCGPGDTSVWSQPFNFMTVTACDAPVELTIDSVEAYATFVSWSEVGEETSWQLQYGIDGFTIGNGTIVDISSNSYYIEGLASNTSYDFYIRSICAGVDTSNWSDTASFITLVSCFEPTELSFTTIESGRGIARWQDNNGASQWEVQYGMTGFIIGEGTTVYTDSLSAELSDVGYGRTYDYYVRTICSDVESSIWVGPYNFNTSCGIVDTFPYVEDFESGVFPPQCWQLESDNSYSWELYTNPDSEHNNAVYVNCFNIPLYEEVELITVDLDLSSMLTRPVFEFDYAYASNSNQSDMLKIYYSGDGGENYFLSESLYGGDNGELNTAGSSSVSYFPEDTEWETYSINLNPGINKIKFTVWSANGNNIFVDNITIKETCTVPSSFSIRDVTTTSAIVNWESPFNDILYQIQYDSIGFNLGSGFQNIVNESSYYLDDLEPGGVYQFYARTVCYEGDTSNWPIAPFVISIPDICHVPSSVSVSNVSSQSASFIIHDDVNRYNINYREIGNNDWQTMEDIRSNFTLSELTENTTYEYQVQANCSYPDGNISDWTEIDTFTTTFPIYNLNVSDPEHGNITSIIESENSDSTRTVFEGQEVTVFATPDEGYTLLYFMIDSVQYYDTTSFVFGTEDIDVSAVMSVIEYSISYNNIDNATHSNPEVYTIESQEIYLANAEQEGYAFDGWYNNSEFTGDIITQIPTGTIGDINLWAHWVEIQDSVLLEYIVPESATISITENGQDIQTGSYVIEGAVIVINAIPELGYTLTSILVNGVEFENGDIYVVGTEPIEISVLTEPIVYDIIYQNAEIAVHSNPDIYTVERESIVLADAQLMGYDFAGWYDNSNYEGNAIVEIPSGSTGDITLWAQWVEIPERVLVDFINTENGILYVTNEGQEVQSGDYVDEGSQLVINVDIDLGYNLELLFVNTTEIENGGIYTVGTDPIYITYIIAPVEYNISYNGLLGVVHTNPSIYTIESAIDLTDAQRDGYIFEGWYENSNYSGTAIQEITTGTTGDITLWARWTSLPQEVMVQFEQPENATITVTLDEQEIQSGDDIYIGSEIRINAVPDEGYTLNSLYVLGVEYQLGTLISVYDPITIELDVSPIEYNILYNNTDNALHTNPSSYTIENETIVLTEAEQTGFVFDGWYDNSNFEGEVVDIIQSGSIGDIYLWANWSMISDSVIVEFIQPENGNITITSNGQELHSGNYIEIGAEIIITAFADEGYFIQNMYVNNSIFENGGSYIINNSNFEIEVEIAPTLVSISETKFSSIYPNPNNGVFTVVANGITKIEVVSSLGEIVKFADVSADKYQVNMQYNAKGIYSVHITTGSKTIVRKVIVE